MRLFGSERIAGVMDRLGLEEGEVITHSMVTRAIEKAQKKVEGHNFEIRKHLLKYDDVMNQQREVIYRQRRDLLMGEDIHDTIEDMINEKADEIAAVFADERMLPEDWDLKGLSDAVFKQYNFRLTPFDADTMDGLNQEGLAQEIVDQAMGVYAQREKMIGPDTLRHLERVVMLQTVDNLWKDHLLSMDHLKEGIGLRGYAQQNPLLVYKKEGFELFQDLIERIKEETVGIMFRIQLAEPQSLQEMQKEQNQDLVFSGGDSQPAKKQPKRRAEKKVGRNDPAPAAAAKNTKNAAAASTIFSGPGLSPPEQDKRRDTCHTAIMIFS